MKITIPVLLLLFIVGCQKDYNNVIDVPVNDIQVLSTGTPNTFVYNSSDSLLAINIKFQSISGLASVYCDIYNPQLSKINSSSFELYDNGNSANGDAVQGDKSYSNKFPMSQYYLSGNYVIKYFYKDNSGNVNLATLQNFTFDNGQSNAPPVISNLSMPDTAHYDQSIKFSVQASDSNGLGDISQVYYQLFRPDGSQIINSQGVSKFSLYDNGDSINNGDAIANDGSFTALLTFPTGQPSGNWTFKFGAVDRGNKSSNELSKIVIVK